MKQLKKSMGAVENRIEKLKKEREVLKEEKE
jgi:phage shock protein A